MILQQWDSLRIGSLNHFGHYNKLLSKHPLSAWNEKHWIKPELIEQTELLQVKLRLTIVDNTANKSEEDNTSEEKTRKKTRKKTREKTREKVLNLIKQDPQITIVQIAAKLDISPKGVEWQLSKLKTDGIIHRVGADNGGYWEIVQQ